MPEVPNWRADLNTTQGPDRYVQHESITQFHRPAFSGTASAESENWGAVNRLGDSLRIAGERGLSIAGDINDRFNQGVCQQKIAEYEVARAAKQRELSQRKGINALENGTGEDVAGVYTEASGWHAMKAHDLMENCNAAQRRYLTQYLDRAGGNFKTWAGNYQDQQQQVYEKNAFDAACTSLVNAGINDDNNIPEYSNSLRNIVIQRGQILGLPKEEAQNIFKKYSEQMITGAIKARADGGDIAGAVSLYQRAAPSLDRSTVVALQTALYERTGALAQTLISQGDYEGARDVVLSTGSVSNLFKAAPPKPKGVSLSDHNLDYNNIGNVMVPGKDGVYQAYKTPKDGVYGMFRQLRSDYKNGRNNIEKILYKYAPPPKNDTKAYIEYVCKKTGLKRDEPLNFDSPGQLGLICEAMATYEHAKKDRLPTKEDFIKFEQDYFKEGKPQPKVGTPTTITQVRIKGLLQHVNAVEAGAEAYRIDKQDGGADGYKALLNIDNEKARDDAINEYRKLESQDRGAQAKDLNAEKARAKAEKDMLAQADRANAIAGGRSAAIADFQNNNLNGYIAISKIPDKNIRDRVFEEYEKEKNWLSRMKRVAQNEEQKAILDLAKNITRGTEDFTKLQGYEVKDKNNLDFLNRVQDAVSSGQFGVDAGRFGSNPHIYNLFMKEVERGLSLEKLTERWMFREGLTTSDFKDGIESAQKKNMSRMRDVFNSIYHSSAKYLKEDDAKKRAAQEDADFLEFRRQCEDLPPDKQTMDAIGQIALQVSYNYTVTTKTGDELIVSKTDRDALLKKRKKDEKDKEGTSVGAGGVVKLDTKTKKAIDELFPVKSDYLRSDAKYEELLNKHYDLILAYLRDKS